MPQHKGRRWISGRAIAIGGCASLLGSLALAGPATPGLAATRAPAAHPAVHVIASNGCQLGNGIKHVVQLTFDNVHFFRDEPNVPHELLRLPNVVLTPHLGSGTRQTREAMTRLVVDNLLAFERGDPPLTPVP